MPSPASKRTSRRWNSFGMRGAPPTRALDEHRAGMERAAREADYLRHAADELKTLTPKDGEETALAERRTTMMQGEKIASDLREAQEAVGGNHSPVPALAAAVRRLERRAGNSPALVEPAVKAIDIAINALEEADQHLNAALIAADFDPAELERIEERLFALRAASRKYSTPVDGLAALAAKYAADVALIDAGADQLKKLEAAAAEADKRYARGFETLGGADQIRRKAQQGRQCRTGAAQTRAREIHDAGRDRRRNRRGRRASTASSSGCRPIRAPSQAR